jgi:hypothetical protein
VDRTRLRCGSPSDRLRLNGRPDVIAVVSHASIPLWKGVKKLRTAGVDSLGSRVLHNRALPDPQIDPACGCLDFPAISTG